MNFLNLITEIERELHRMNKNNNTISEKDTPFYNCVSNSFFTNDFSESELEIITPVSDSIDDVLNILKNLHNVAYKIIENYNEYCYLSKRYTKI